MLKISHRGLSSPPILPRGGNHIKAFEVALEEGADMIEMDVRLHNEKLILSHEIKIPKHAPSLESALDFLKGKCEINLEIKNPGFIYENIDTKVLKMVNDMNMQDDVIISSFNHHTIKHIRDIDKKIRTGIIYSAMWLKLGEEVEYIKPYSIHPEYDIAFCLDTVILSRRGYKVFPWVAKTKQEIQKAKDFKHIDGVMVDDLGLFD